MKLEGLFVQMLNRKYNDLKEVILKSGWFENIELEQGSDPESYLSNKKKGIELVFSKEKYLVGIHLFSVNIQGYNEFKTLPLGIEFSMSREQINKLFEGIQKNEGGNINTPILGWMNLWEDYTLENATIQIHYSKDEKSIEYITIVSLNEEE